MGSREQLVFETGDNTRRSGVNEQSDYQPKSAHVIPIPQRSGLVLDPGIILETHESIEEQP